METKIEEIWKDIPEFIGYYQASNLGRIRRKKSSRILKQSYTDYVGYMYVCTCIHGKKLSRSVHTMVAKAFVHNPLNLGYVNHKDGNKLNNVSDNLEWTTKSGDTIHAIKTGLITRFGHNIVVDKDLVQYVDAKKNDGLNQKEIAEIIGINPCTVSRIINRKRQYAKFN